MNDRDRLIELIADIQNDFEKWCVECAEDGHKDHQPLGEYLADKLLANGVIVADVSVGQTVYIIDTDEYGDYPYALDVKISGIGKDECGVWVKMDLPLGMKRSGYIGATDIGKTVFLTKEEAERALKEREG